MTCTSDRPAMTRSSRILSALLIIATTMVMVPRLTPIGNGDFFSHATVAERLMAGDRLYVDVWDNKDPYYYYALALADTVGGWGFVLLELLWVAIAIGSLVLLARNRGDADRGWALAAAWGIAPWALLGLVYAGAMSVMPGVAVALLVLALASADRWLLAGLALGVLLFLKVILVPVAVMGALAFWSTPRVRSLTAAATGALATTLVGLGILVLRDELLPYFSMLQRNSGYASRMVDDSIAAGFIGHLERAFPPGGIASERTALAATTLAVLVCLVLRPSRLAVAAALSLVGGIVVLGLTAIWGHHAQLLAIPAGLAVLSLCQVAPPRRATHFILTVPILLAAAYLMGGATPVGQILIKPATALQPINQLDGDSPEAQSIAGLDLNTFSRLGRNDQDAHARGLDDLELACPDFQQYPFDPQTTYDRVLDCLVDSDVVFVSTNFADQDYPAAYLTFTEAARAILGTYFVCTDTSYGQRCLREARA